MMQRQRHGKKMTFARIYLFIYLFLFYFLLECLWSAKMLKIKGQLAFTKPHLFGQFIFTRNPCWIRP